VVGLAVLMFIWYKINVCGVLKMYLYGIKFMAFGQYYIWPFDIFYGHLVYFMAI
jgi:hypothetical protein